MISPLPFLGPIGAVRIGHIEGQLVVNPTLEQLEGSTLDLIVVGTSEALTMVEAGGDDRSRGHDPRGARARPRRDPQKLRGTLEQLRAEVGKPKWVDVDLSAELDAAHGEAVLLAIAVHGIREAGTVVEALVEDPPGSRPRCGRGCTRAPRRCGLRGTARRSHPRLPAGGWRRSPSSPSAACSRPVPRSHTGGAWFRRRSWRDASRC